jgi:hypothetical protein
MVGDDDGDGNDEASFLCLFYHIIILMAGRCTCLYFSIIKIIIKHILKYKSQQEFNSL